MPDGEKEKINLEMAEALDEMEKSLSSDNADFLEKILKRLRAGKELTEKETAKLEALYNKHFGEDEAEGSEDEDDIDEDDFV